MWHVQQHDNPPAKKVKCNILSENTICHYLDPQSEKCKTIYVKSMHQGMSWDFQ